MNFVNEMKRCGRCQYENTDAMSFCLQCGTPLAAAPDAAFNRSAETLVGGSRSPFVPANFTANAPNARPKSSKKIFLILGGVFSLFALLILAGALIVFFNWKSKNVVATANQSSPSPAPTRGIADRSPVPKPSSPPDSRSVPTESPTAPSATPQTSFTPPSEPTKKGTFTIYANGGWQLSEIDTVPNENFRTSAAGLIDLAKVKTGVTTKGVTDAASKSRRIYPEYPTGALMMRTRYADGKFSNVQPVTAAPSLGLWQNFPDERGRLEFCVNDNAPAENGGQFTVTKTSISVPKGKK